MSPAVRPTSDARLARWAGATWASMAAMSFDDTGLPADGIGEALAMDSRSRYTSPTNIGGYLWSTVAARELGILDAAEARTRIRLTLTSVARLERHGPSGMFFNWYDPADGRLLHRLPDGGSAQPFLSSVDNGWLAAGLLVAASADENLAGLARHILRDMDFAAFYDPDAVDGCPGGLLRGGFWTEDAPPGSVPGPGGVQFTGHHYGQLNSEPRIASYLAVAFGQVPTDHLACLGRYELCGADGRPAADPAGVLPGVRRDGTVQSPVGGLVPTFGGSAFEALMPALLVPESAWSPRAWLPNHRVTVAAQRDFGLRQTDFGSWGFSPASDPAGGYAAWGVASLGILGTGYPSDQERTSWADGLADGWGDGVVTPHALFLALLVAPGQAADALELLEAQPGVVGPGGFDDAVAVKSGLRSHRHLCLDQSMIMAAIADVACDSAVQRYCCAGTVGATLQPLLAEFRFATTDVDTTGAAA